VKFGSLILTSNLHRHKSDLHDKSDSCCEDHCRSSSRYLSRLSHFAMFTIFHLIFYSIILSDRIDSLSSINRCGFDFAGHKCFSEDSWWVDRSGKMSVQKGNCNVRWIRLMDKSFGQSLRLASIFPLEQGRLVW
jgi:hypothetical protein